MPGWRRSTRLNSTSKTSWQVRGTAAATSRARRVLPQPPAPVKVTRCDAASRRVTPGAFAFAPNEGTELEWKVVGNTRRHVADDMSIGRGVSMAVTCSRPPRARRTAPRLSEYRRGRSPACRSCGDNGNIGTKVRHGRALRRKARRQFQATNSIDGVRGAFVPAQISGNGCIGFVDWHVILYINTRSNYLVSFKEKK